MNTDLRLEQVYLIVTFGAKILIIKFKKNYSILLNFFQQKLLLDRVEMELRIFSRSMINWAEGSCIGKFSQLDRTSQIDSNRNCCQKGVKIIIRYGVQLKNWLKVKCCG